MDTTLHLVSDLDGTWLPADGRAADLRELEQYLVHLHGLILTFATGRSLYSAVTEVSRRVQLWPSHFVTDVGTAVYHRAATGKWIEDAEYARKIDDLWDREAAERISLALPEGVRRQPDLWPRRRLALEVLPGFDLQRAAEELTTRLAQARIVADVLPSNGCCLDVLPKGVNKGAAIEYLESCIQLPSLLMVCGDSENDLGMFRLADLAVVMADSPLRADALGVPLVRVIRPTAPGPAGILEALSSMRVRETSIEGQGSHAPQPRLVPQGSAS
jgi:HAD superfamily hydrolase (TIGR01484 family)